MIRALTFDLWDTVIHDDSDEPKRRAQGLRSKRDERRHMVFEALAGQGPADRDAVWLAYDVAEAAFRHVWHHSSITWTVPERLAVVLSGLGRELPGTVFDDLVRRHEEMEIEVAPDPIEGVGEALAELAARYPLAVVSDAIVSPGRCLREWLRMHDLARHFQGFAFSDEVGHSKPHPEMFASAARQLGVAVEDLLHIGDRDHNDVQGPHRLGMKAVLFTGTRDADRATTRADAVCTHHRELPAIVERLVRESRA